MRPGNIFNRIATVRNYSEGTKDKYGNAAKIFTEYQMKCRIDPIPSEEILDDSTGLRNSSVEYFKIFLDDLAVINVYDEIVFDDKTYKVYSLPQLFYDYNSPHHWEVKVRRYIV